MEEYSCRVREPDRYTRSPKPDYLLISVSLVFRWSNPLISNSHFLLWNEWRRQSESMEGREKILCEIVSRCPMDWNTLLTLEKSFVKTVDLEKCFPSVNSLSFSVPQLMPEILLLSSCILLSMLQEESVSCFQLPVSLFLCFSFSCLCSWKIRIHEACEDQKKKRGRDTPRPSFFLVFQDQHQQFSSSHLSPEWCRPHHHSVTFPVAKPLLPLLCFNDGKREREGERERQKQIWKAVEKALSRFAKKRMYRRKSRREKKTSEGRKMLWCEKQENLFLLTVMCPVMSSSFFPFHPHVKIYIYPLKCTSFWKRHDCEKCFEKRRDPEERWEEMLCFFQLFFFNWIFFFLRRRRCLSPEAVLLLVVKEWSERNEESMSYSCVVES